MTITIPLQPITKKNSQQILVNRSTGRPFIAPSKQYKKYKADCAPYLTGIIDEPISEPVCVKCVYYMQTRRRVDLVNLLESTLDILQDYNILADDCSTIVASHDGSAVYHDKENPRTEIEITKLS